MEHEITDVTFSITNSYVTFETILAKPYIPLEYMESIQNANLLFIPEENFKNTQGLFFPESTLEFLNYIKDSQNSLIIPEIAISDEDFQRLELHSSSINVATFIVTMIVLPIAINLVSGFLLNEAQKHHRDPSNLNAEVNIIVESGTNYKHISYKGPISEIQDTLNSALPMLLDGEDNDDKE